jgi:phosphatidylinositol glycan class C protein
MWEALLLAGILRLLSSVLRTLTASYSSDTVYALAISGMLVHLLACDYSYANGHGRKKAAFAGGVMSLNASLFSTTLLASRLSSNATVYVFVSTSVILFAFYPAARHTIAVTQPHASNGTLENSN